MKLASGEALPVLLLLLELVLEPALTLRADGYKFGEPEMDRLLEEAGLERETERPDEWSWEPLTARAGSREGVASVKLA